MFNEDQAIASINTALRKGKYPTIKEWEIDGRGNNYHAKIYARNGSRKTYVGLGYAKYCPSDYYRCQERHDGGFCKKKARNPIHTNPSVPGYHPFKNSPRSHGMGRKLALSRAVEDLLESYKNNE